MNKLQWFKFVIADWGMGKIQRCPEVTQLRFIRLCCLYWNKECILSLEDAEIEIDKEHIDILISKKIVKIEDGFIIIDFLLEQMDSISETSKKRREAVLHRWEKLKQKNTSVLQKNTNVLQSDTDKSRVEEIREEKKRVVNKFAAPTLLEVQTYFTENGYTNELGKKAFDYYSVANWKDSKGQQVKNWKQKMRGVWFKDENKQKQPQDKNPIIDGIRRNSIAI